MKPMRSSTNLSTLVIFLLAFCITPLHSQVIPEPVADESIYSFLDELAADGIISFNQAVKPYSRKMISGLLDEAAEHNEEMTPRQKKELEFFITSFGMKTEPGKMKLVYNPATAQYRDSMFNLTVSPILGIGYSSDGSVAWKNGAKAYGNYGNWGFFAALQDNHQDPLLGDPAYVTRERGGHIKNGTDFSEMTGGVSYMWKWGGISFLKDVPVWGSGYAGTNILSGRAPSFMQIKLHLKPAGWFEMTWLYGWLNSMVVDSARSYWVTNSYGLDYREVYHNKYISTNLFTFTPFRRFNISAGNSVVWSDSRLSPYYLMPFFFYKSVDHGMSSGIDNSNAQMFIDISSHNIKHLHLYGTLFIDELSTERFTTSDYNFFSWKGGARAGNFSFLPNLWLTAECTFTYPLTFQHYVPTITYENQGYNMGHWLRDNSRSWWFALDYKPIRGMTIRLWHERSERGPDYQSLGGPRVGLPYLESIEWCNIATGLELRCLITGGVQVKAALIKSDIEGEESWTAPHLYGQKTTVSAGIVWGF
jgi:hypothetical protein